MSGDMSNNPDTTTTLHAYTDAATNTPSTSLPTAPAPSAADADHPRSDDSIVQACWGRVNQRMRNDIGDAAWRHWIKPLRVSRLEDGTLTLEAEFNLGPRAGKQPICRSAAGNFGG